VTEFGSINRSPGKRSKVTTENKEWFGMMCKKHTFVAQVRNTRLTSGVYVRKTFIGPTNTGA